MNPDSLRRFLLEKQAVRGSIVSLRDSWMRIRTGDDYSPPIAHLLGEATAAAALLGRNLKFDGRLTLQLQGPGPVSLLVIQCSSAMELRGLVRCRAEAQGEPVRLEGCTLSVTVDPAGKGERYTSLIPVAGTGFGDCLELYYRDSVQIPTAFWLQSTPEAVSGLMLQRLPGRDADGVSDAHWQALLTDVSQRLQGALALSSDADTLCNLFPEQLLRVFDAEPVSFRCDCASGVLERTLRLLGAAELTGLAAEQGFLDVRCEFCNRQYRLDPDQLSAVLAGSPIFGSESLN